MKSILLSLLLLLALPLAALAQEGEPAPAAPQSPDTAEVNLDDYSKFSSTPFGFSVLLPKSGTISQPGDPSWDEADEIAFSWFGAETDPVVLIQGRVDEFETTLDADTFKAFCDELEGHWSRDDTKYKVLSKDPALAVGSHTWNLLQIEDTSNAEGRVYYSVFSTYVGKNIYTISLYYLEPVNASIQNFGKPVLQGFSIP